MKIMSGAFVVILFSSGSFALAAEPPYAPGSRPQFPEPVERAMIGEGSANARQMGGHGVLEISQGSLVFGVQRSSRGSDVTVGVIPYGAPLNLSELKEYPEVENAFKLLDDGKFDEGVAELREAARENPNLPSMYVMMYRVLAAANQPKPVSDTPGPAMVRPSALDAGVKPQTARSWLEKAVVTTPKDPEPWLLLGEIAMQENRIGEAELDFAQAKELLGCYSNAHRKAAIEPAVLSGMASVKERREQFAEAQTLLEEYLKHTPNDVAVRLRLARVLFRQSKSYESYAELKEAKKIDVNESKRLGTPEKLLPAAAMIAQYYDEYQHSLNQHYMKSEQAKEYFKFALKQAPNDLNLRAAAADWALQNNEMEMANEQAKEARRIESEDVNRPLNQRKYPWSIIGPMVKARVALWQGNWAEAEKGFLNVVVMRPLSFEARDGLALAIIEQGGPKSKQRALEYAEFGNLSERPNDPAALTTVAWVRFRRGEFPLATEAIEKAIKAAGLDSKLVDAERLDPDDRSAKLLLMSDLPKFARSPGPGGLHFGHPLSVKLRNLQIYSVAAHIYDACGRKYQAREILRAVLQDGQPFLMKPEAEELYKKVKDAKEP